MSMTHTTRRTFMKTAATAAATATLATSLRAAQERTPVIDAHMHVWSDNQDPFPYAHPYSKGSTGVKNPASADILIEDMDNHGVTHSILVQTICHGWDNSYTSDCLQRFPDRFRAHGLIDPVDPDVADKLDYWMSEHGFSGMRFSPIYYQNGQHGGDDWINAKETHQLWRKAQELGAVFNYFIAPKQLPKLEKMLIAFPKMPIVIDHLSQLDLGVRDPNPDLKLLLNLAKYPNVWVKVSELSSVSKSGEYPFRDAFPQLKQVYESFGPDRLLFGTGYPGSAREAYDRPTLRKEIDLILKEYTFLQDQDRQKILGKNAARLWGFAT